MRSKRKVLSATRGIGIGVWGGALLFLTTVAVAAFLEGNRAYASTVCYPAPVSKAPPVCSDPEAASAIWGLGQNESGQLGDGTNDARLNPVRSRIPAATAFTDVACLGWHSLALTVSGRIWAWGLNSDGQLGDGSNIDSNIPVEVIDPDPTSHFIDIAAGANQSVAVKQNGTVYVWGSFRDDSREMHNWGNAPVLVEGLPHIMVVEGGRDFFLALDKDGEVWAWGDNEHGQLGNGTYGFSSVPVQVANLANVVAIGAGISHSLAVDADGTVWAWGANAGGSLGVDSVTLSFSNVPLKVQGITGAVSFARHIANSIALKPDGKVWAWGYDYGTTPVLVEGLPDDIVEITGGRHHNLALSASGKVYGWGYNYRGELGGAGLGSYSPPAQVQGLPRIIAISGGVGHSLFLSSGASVIPLPPPPPVSQSIGITDSVFNRMGATECRACHEDLENNEPRYLADRHHLRLGEPVQSHSDIYRPTTGNVYECLNCHENLNGALSVFLDCRDCHNQRNPSTYPDLYAATVHHRKSASDVIKDCKACHELIDNPNDGHFIPTYDPDETPPRTRFGTGNQGQGGCMFCHNEGTDQSSGVQVYRPEVTHHSTGLASPPFDSLLSLECLLCHAEVNGYLTPEVDRIRTCENCHGINSLHRIQVDSNGNPWYGHIGDERDCKGCHGDTIPQGEIPFEPGPFSPHLDRISRTRVVQGAETTITIHGSDLMDQVVNPDGTVTTVTSRVVLIDPAGEETFLAPAAITETELTSTLPADLSAGSYTVRLEKATLRSNMKNMAIVPHAVITNFTCVPGETDSHATITGHGFGAYFQGMDLKDSGIGVATNLGPCTVKTWEDTQITALCDRACGAEVTVSTLFGSVGFISPICIPTGSPESVCNGVDDDCDGAIDEEYASVPTTCGTGACTADGWTSCVNGSLVDSCTPGKPTTETCADGIDNDCDGTADCDDTDCQKACNEVTVLLPNGAEVIPAGSAHSIQWGAPPSATSFNLAYSLDDGQSWNVIKRNVTGRSYDWQVPTPLMNKESCLVRVIGFDVNGERLGADRSDAVFTIEVVRLMSPNGGETLTSGATYPITWETATTLPVAEVRLSFSRNGGTTWERIVWAPDNPGRYDWTVPALRRTRNGCLVRVVLKSPSGDTVGRDLSDGPFTIQP